MRHDLQQNFFAGALYLALGLAGIFVLIPIGVDEPANVEFRALAPAYWPKVICYLLGLLGLAILGRSLLALRNDRDRFEESNASEFVWWRVALVISGTFLLYSTIEYLGFVLATAIALVVLMLLAGERRLHLLAPVALGVPLALYFFFTKAASIPIPNGILEPILTGI